MAEEGEAEYKEAVKCMEVSYPPDRKKAYELLAKAAAQGHAPAQSALGEYLLFGYGVAKINMERSFNLFAQASEKGDPQGLFGLGQCYRRGDGVDTDPAKAEEYHKKFLEIVKKAHGDNLDEVVAKISSPQTLYSIGICNYFGYGVPKNESKAVGIFEKAAATGHATSQFTLAICYDTGIGVPAIDKKKYTDYLTAAANQGHVLAQRNLASYYKSDERGLELYKAAADQGDASSQYALGSRYCSGEGVPKDFKKGAEFYTLAANQNHAGAMYRLGECYSDGIGVGVDKVRAAKLYEAASQKGNANAQHNLACCYLTGDGVPISKTKAAELFVKAAEKGHVDAAAHAGHCYFTGDGVLRDKAMAVNYYKKAAEKGSALAQFNLGIMFMNGDEVRMDKARAVQLFEKSAIQGNVEAQQALGGAYLFGNGVEKNLAKAADWLVTAADQGNVSARRMLDTLKGQVEPQVFANMVKAARANLPNLVTQSRGPVRTFGSSATPPVFESEKKGRDEGSGWAVWVGAVGVVVGIVLLVYWRRK